jgi:hypothetical protein
MRTWKTVLLIAGIVILIVFAPLITVPLLFRDQVTERVKAEINRNVDAQVDFGSVGITFFRNFPNITFSLNDLSVAGVDAFAGDTLATVGRFRLVLDVGSVIRAYRHDAPLVVRSIDVAGPSIHARVLEDGRASWDIFREEEARPAREDEAAPFNVGLRRFAITDGRVLYEDERTGLRARLDGLDHELRGDFTRSHFDLRTRTHVDGVTVSHRGIPYLSGVVADLTADLAADLDARRFTFRENQLQLNELGLGFDGSVALADGGVELDVTFAADRAEFRDILSFVPALYLRDFGTIQTSGNVAVNGHARGLYADGLVPSFALNVDVADGMFRYPDLPLPARNIVADVAIGNPGGDLDGTVVDVRRFAIQFGDDPFEARLRVATPVSDPDIDLAMKGRIDLADVGRTLKLEGVEELAGVVTTDAEARTRLSYVETGQYERVTALGHVEARDIRVAGTGVERPASIEELLLELSPSRAELRALRGTMGSSDFQATGSLDNVLGFALRGEPLRGQARLTSGFFLVDEWRSDDELAVVPVPPYLDMALTAAVARIRHEELELTDARGAVRVRDERVTVEDFVMRGLGGEIVASGYYETTDLAAPTFDINLALKDIDIPTAAATVTTVRLLAPVTPYATGSFTADVRAYGVLGPDLMPRFELLNGTGSFRTANVAIRDFPALVRASEVVGLPQLRDPGLRDFASAMEIRDGRVHVEPFDVGLGASRMLVSGSNGFDQTLDYAIVLEVPRTELGAEADRLITGLLAEVGRVGVDLQAADAVRLNLRLGGTVTDPSVGVDFGSAVTGAREQVTRLVEDEAARRLEDVERRVDAAREEATARARTEADRILRDAEEQAARIREEAERLAETVRTEGYAQADRLLEEARTPVARLAAGPAANRIRQETDDRAAQLIRESDRRAEQVLDEARRRADALLDEEPPAGEPPTGAPPGEAPQDR